jgi:beta-glucosidase
VDGRNLWAILHAGPLGTMSGHAIAELLTGEASPSGRLAVAVTHDDGDAGLPFGHGLSYSDVMLGNLAIDAGPDRIGLTCEVENRGDRRGSETVQIYLDAFERVHEPAPIKSSRLVAFRKVWFNPGEREVLHFELGRSEFGFPADAESDPTRSGRYRLRVGLDAKRALTREIVLTKSLAKAMGRQTANPSPLQSRQKA